MAPEPQIGVAHADAENFPNFIQFRDTRAETPNSADRESEDARSPAPEATVEELKDECNGLTQSQIVIRAIHGTSLREDLLDMRKWLELIDDEEYSEFHDGELPEPPQRPQKATKS